MLKLSKKLFWDVDPRQLNERKHADFIIGRVLQWGDIDDFRELKKHYSLRTIRRLAAQTNFIDRKSQNFWQIIFNLNHLVCTRKPLQKRPANFLLR